MKLTIRDLIRLRHCESHYRLGKLGLYAASKRTQFFYQKKDSLILALSKGPTSFSEALEKAFLEYSRDWFLNNRQYETCRDQDLARWHRFADWFFEQGYQILKTRLCSAISVNTSCNHVAVSELSAQADLVLKKGEHVYALSIFPNEPQYSVRARKQETQAYYSLELLSQYLISAPAYGQETISMICYLKSKEDKADFLASQYTERKCYLQMGYGGIAEATQALLSTIQLSVPQKCEYCRYTDVCHQQNTSALAPEKQPEETSIPVPAETVDLEKGLTPEQRRVVEHMDGPMAVIAVPGAGKTHCLIARMVRMIKNGILPEQILFVTFTKKAAGEILERARRVLGEESALPAIFTFHSLGYTILRKHEDFIGKSLKIAEKVDYYRLILQIIDEISPLSGIDYDGLTGDFGLLSRIYNAVLSIEKDGLEEWKKHADFPDPDGLGCLYQKLKERMKEEGYICFDEQIQLTNQLFSEYPDVLKSYQQRFRFVMIDEFQDISSDQVDLVYAIASHGNIVVVGDDDQSIYSWRGGSNYYLLHFQEMWSNSKIVILPDNFRSVDHILEAANALIANNTNRYRKSLRSHHRATVRPIYRKNVLVDTIRDLVASAERSGYKPGDIAIIARKNKALEKIKKSLDGFYLATSPKTLLIKDEVFIAIRDTFSLYVTNFHDPLALYRQLKRNGYELDIPVERDHMLESFLKYFNLPEPDLYDPDLLEIYEASGSPGIALARTLSSCKKLLYAQDLSDAVRSIYQFLWQKKEHPAVEELCSRIEMRAINTASEFLNHMNAMIEFSDTAEVEYPASPDTITLLTAHKSKGKEFPTVVIYGVEEFEESEEGRNLLYVSMTRAKRNLFLLQGSFSDAPLYPEFKNYVD